LFTSTNYTRQDAADRDTVRPGLWCFGAKKNQRKIIKIWEVGRGGKETLADKPLDFKNPVWQETWPMIGSV